MSPSRFLSSISLVAITTGAGAGCGGGDDSCGPEGAPDVGLVASGAATLTFGGLRAGLNNDCPASDAPSGVTSLTLIGTQTDGSGFITLCVSRPDRLAEQAQTLALDNPAAAVEVRLVDVTGTASNCSFAIDRTQPASGTATTTGMCGQGADPAGFALVIDGALALKRTCGTTVDSIPITLRGRVAVSPM